MGRSAVFLDRDGVINRAFVIDGKPYAPTRRSEVELLDGVGPSLSALRKRGFVNLVVTNQPDLSTGKQNFEELESTHRWMRDTLDIDAILVCPHLRNDNCGCRKPKPGLLNQAKQLFGIDYGKSFLVGDRWSDIEMGQAVGVHTSFFVDYDYLEPRPSGQFISVKSLCEATEKIIELTEKTNESTGSS